MPVIQAWSSLEGFELFLEEGDVGDPCKISLNRKRGGGGEYRSKG